MKIVKYISIIILMVGYSCIKPQRTLAIIKPNVVREGNATKILVDILNNGFDVVALKKVQLNNDQVRQFYGSEHAGKSWFKNLENFMTSGQIYILILEKNNAIEDWRKLMGPTSITDARVNQPTSLRAKYGTYNPTDPQSNDPKLMNAVHGSDSPASAQREIQLFFPTI